MAGGVRAEGRGPRRVRRRLELASGLRELDIEEQWRSAGDGWRGEATGAEGMEKLTSSTSARS